MVSDEPASEASADSNRREITPPRTQPSYWYSIGLGTLVGTAIFLGGYLLCIDDHTDYGVVIFILVPFAAGVCVGRTMDRRNAVSSCLLTTLLLSLSTAMLTLILSGSEGYICCLMALPLLLIGMAFGTWFGLALQPRSAQRRSDDRRRTLMLLISCPVFIAAADRLEKPHRMEQRLETFSTEISVAGTPQQAWKAIAQLNNLSGARPFLLRIGLPTPLSCELEADRVGASRTCHFDQGRIAQTVTIWNEPAQMKFQVMESTLPGRRWLSFVDAGYELKPDGKNTTIVRHSQIASRLYPRWYWRPFEEWGVASEHDYVLENIRANLSTR